VVANAIALRITGANRGDFENLNHRRLRFSKPRFSQRKLKAIVLGVAAWGTQE
jgi:hypothetical protein